MAAHLQARHGRNPDRYRYAHRDGHTVRYGHGNADPDGDDQAANDAAHNATYADADRVDG